MGLQVMWDAAVARSEGLRQGSFAAVPFSLVTSQENLVVGYAAGSLKLVPRTGGAVRRLQLLGEEVGHVFSDRTDGGTPVNSFAASKADRITLALRPPELGLGAPRPWSLRLTLHSWNDARFSVPLEDGSAGLAVGVGPGVGPVAEAMYVMAFGPVRVERELPDPR
ncbi:hypothetical protein [Microbacterium sp. APC 3901]|uniref:hypothetical protein n=1 Tax=Microbacterium sp. APC 3901 TaxID=3035192 RepID=UPI0025B5F958|nr:hypothetical protein [Microbacterium sp. APC 3901]MDN3445739.1 hypothetical protein [Microbacterium sp. APC 3901]